MKNDVLIKVENVSKKFSRDLKKSLWYGIKDIGSDLIGSSNNKIKLRKKEFWALENNSFELKRGEVLGLIGRNGAGKTTLLKLLNGLTKPDSGKITMRGRVGALIALGAGFNPILTGRENVYVNGSVLGLSKKEIDNKFDEIVDFAELWDFIDTPVQSYSSGMQVRLGFAVATAMNTDILLLDEVLAVGDGNFKAKCYRKIDEIRENSATIFVSHSLEHLGRICNKALVLEKGKTTYLGNISEGLIKYRSYLDGKQESEKGVQTNNYPVKSLNLMIDKSKLNYGEDLTITIETYIQSESKIQFRFIFFGYPSKNVAGEINSNGLNIPSIHLNKGRHTFSVFIPNLYLLAGKYSIGYNILGRNNKLISSGSGHLNIEVEGAGIGETYNQINAKVKRY